MDELNTRLPGSDIGRGDVDDEPARSDAFAGDARTAEVAQRADDDRPLFGTTDAIDPEATALEESRDDAALRGAAHAGALGDSVPLGTAGLTGYGAALGVNAEAGQPVEATDEEHGDRAPGD
jgi:hypothetical protein